MVALGWIRGARELVRERPHVGFGPDLRRRIEFVFPDLPEGSVLVPVDIRLSPSGQLWLWLGGVGYETVTSALTAIAGRDRLDELMPGDHRIQTRGPSSSER